MACKAGLNPHAAVFVPRWRTQEASTLPTLAPKQTEQQEDALLLTDLPSEVQLLIGMCNKDCRPGVPER